MWHFQPRSTPVPFLVLHRVRGGFLGEMTIEQVWHFQPRSAPVPFLVLHRVRAGEGCGFLGEMTIEQVWHFQPRSAPVPFLVLHRVRAGEGCRVAHMLECDTEPVALLASGSSPLSCCSVCCVRIEIFVLWWQFLPRFTNRGK